MSDEARAPGVLLLAAVALLSAATLGYEVLLTRLLAIVQWHHFAFLVISTALLGFGASGAFLVVVGNRLRVPAGPFLALCALAFAVAAPACFALAQRVPFNVLELPWSLRPLGWLLVIELLLAMPFFIAATGIGRTLIVFGDRLSRVYAVDLAGAGAGAALAVGLLWWLPPDRAPGGLGAMAALAGGLAVVRARRSTRRALLAFAAVIFVLLITGPAGWNELRISPFKPLPQALRVSGAKLAETRSGPLGLVSAVENEKVPLRWAPGLSLLARAPVPEQVALFVDGDGPIAIPRRPRASPPPAYLDALPSALPYHLQARPRVLVLGAGGGAPVLQALGGGAPEVDAVELQPDVGALARDRYNGFAAGTLDPPPAVRLHVGDPRAFVESARGGEYDLIQVDALGASPSGLHALKAERLLTVESMRAMLARLAPRGLVAITGWSELPPRSGPRLLATLLEALAAEGIEPAADHLAWIRSWNTNTLVASRTPLSRAQVAAVRSFARARAFDLVHVPGMEAGEANRYNVMERPWFREAAARLLGPEREEFIRGYKFDIRPATDDRPYLWSFFRWAHAPEILALSREGGIGLLAIGYLALPAALVQAAVASAALILLPLLLVRRRAGRGVPGARRGAALAGFFALGLAFLMMEIAFISPLHGDPEPPAARPRRGARGVPRLRGRRKLARGPARVGRRARFRRLAGGRDRGPRGGLPRRPSLAHERAPRRRAPRQDRRRGRPRCAHRDLDGHALPARPRPAAPTRPPILCPGRGGSTAALRSSARCSRPGSRSISASRSSSDAPPSYTPRQRSPSPGWGGNARMSRSPTAGRPNADGGRGRFRRQSRRTAHGGGYPQGPHRSTIRGVGTGAGAGDRTCFNPPGGGRPSPRPMDDGEWNRDIGAETWMHGRRTAIRPGSAARARRFGARCHGKSSASCSRW